MADANSSRIRQTWQRGEQAEFRFSFVNSAGDALVPLDANKYPSYAFISPAGLQVQTGVAQANGTPGNYRVLWTIPVDADLSNDEMSWQLQVNFVTARRSQLSHTFDFFVVDKQVTSTGRKDIVNLAIQDSDHRVFWRGDFDPAEITFECYASPWPDMQDIAPVPHAAPLTKANMTKVIDGDSIIYYYDIPAAQFKLWDALNNHYTGLWSVRETMVSELQVEYDQFRVIKKNMLQYIQSLRFMVDRFQHRLGTPQHISDGDICEALTQGLGLFNGWFPVSNYSWTDFPQQCTTYWIMLSMWWMLGSQHMLMGQLAFSFSGQAVTLDYDQTTVIDSAISRLTEWLNAHMTPQKLMINRQRTGVGSLGIRTQRAFGAHGRVMRYDTTRGVDSNVGFEGVLNAATTFGIFL